ncbi:hypothetical protein V501_04635 [Pseudogymnoascus sp. VKM F-4519 (FW-2642)]|nr:hypothetical protein V501_04635 [Pseudogymnoascus sp. VKM F-4519 (FW-2642)]
MAGGLFQCSHVPRHGNWIGNSAPPRSAIGEVPSIGIVPQAISTASKLHAAKASRVLEERKEENEKKDTDAAGMHATTAATDAPLLHEDDATGRTVYLVGPIQLPPFLPPHLFRSYAHVDLTFPLTEGGDACQNQKSQQNMPGIPSLRPNTDKPNGGVPVNLSPDLGQSKSNITNLIQS